jgi:hypothetical protein
MAAGDGARVNPLLRQPVIRFLEVGLPATAWLHRPSDSRGMETKKGEGLGLEISVHDLVD